MFSVPDGWGDDEDDKQVQQAGKEILPKDAMKKKAHLALTKLKRKADAVTSSPSLTRGLLDDSVSDLDEPHLSKKKEKRKGKLKEVKSIERNKSSSTSSLASLTSAGSILRKGIKFANLQEFCAFMEGGNKKKKRKRRGSSEAGEENADVPAHVATKKAKFDPERLREALEGKEPGEGEGSASSGPASKAKTKLNSSHFRHLNELLYTQTGSQSRKMFSSDREAFRAYHNGYMEQASRWPSDPMQNVVADIMKRSGTPVIADFGCGEARLSRSLPSHTVHSFDFVALNGRVTECDMASTPLHDSSVDVAVFCLSLMGTNLKDYLKEANRVLKEGGTLKIAEVESRFKDVSVDDFVAFLDKFGFALKWKDIEQGFFVYMDFRKTGRPKKKAPAFELKPCYYKKR